MWPIKTQLRGTHSKSGSSPSLDIESAGPLTLDFRTSRPSAVYYLQRLQYFVIVPRQACTILKINWATAATVAGLTTASLPSSFLSSTFPSASLDFPLQQHLPVCLGRGDQNPHGNKWSYAILTGMAAQKKQQNNRAVENPPLASRHMCPSCIGVSGPLWNLYCGTWHPTFQTADSKQALQSWL